ncbi:hypothetical protein KP509_14G013500 [Ceratopteris richardii]|uniref:DUF4220 domain-containing protein n=1 Tax=Ceratopteris richardii TaxID=49495 RepID=A0A8T2T7M9_CERRI|nr:hypothetical protein KP509_14G013500 [Ceratopteris richardii]
MVNTIEASSSFVNFEQQLVHEFFRIWWIPSMVLLSMTLQLVLLVRGGACKWSIWLRATVWPWPKSPLPPENYTIWALVLLFHMGALDNISAYAMEDAELWLCHGLLMILQVISAIFVIANSVYSWKYDLFSICLLLAGSVKYAECTLARRCSSNTTIVEAVLAFYRFIRFKPSLSLPVKGVGEVPPQDCGERFFYIVSGEPFALFKLYRRQLTSLFMYEWRSSKIRKLFLLDMSEVRFFRSSTNPEKDIPSVLDMELRFLFDSIYTKDGGTTYTALSVIFWSPCFV